MAQIGTSPARGAGARAISRDDLVPAHTEAVLKRASIHNECLHATAPLRSQGFPEICPPLPLLWRAFGILRGEHRLNGSLRITHRSGAPHVPCHRGHLAKRDLASAGRYGKGALR